MFGEDTMLGNKTVKLDEKGRLFLPKFTYAEKNDVLEFAKKNEILILYSFITLKKKIEELKNKYYLSSNKETLDRIDNEFNELYSSCITDVKVDSQRRILIPRDIVLSYNMQDSIHVQAHDNYVKLLKK